MKCDVDETNSTFAELAIISYFLTEELTNTIANEPRDEEKADIAGDTNDDENVDGNNKQYCSNNMRHIIFIILSVSLTKFNTILSSSIISS